MTDLTLSEFEWCKDEDTLGEALREEARNLLGPEHHPGRPKREEQQGRASSFMNWDVGARSTPGKNSFEGPSIGKKGRGIEQPV